jgi:serpin B
MSSVRPGTWIAGLLVCALGSGAGTGTGAAADSSAASDPAAAVADGNNRFALDLYGKVKDGEGNFFFSPFSISTAFAMVHAGARGATRDEMTRVFHFPGPLDVEFGYKDVIQGLRGDAESGGYRLDVADCLWGWAGSAFSPDYVKIAWEHYAAEVKRVDFGNSEKARSVINRWVAKNTEGKIPELLPPGLVDRSTRLVLTNAVYFKGTWVHAFGKDSPDRPFHTDAKRTKSVPMMHCQEEFPYGQEQDLQILKLPYKDSALSMVVLLPGAIDGLSRLEAGLEPDTLRAWMERTRTQEVTVNVPRFRFRTALRLGDTLSKMGMPTAFGNADFSGMTEEKDLFLSEVVHQAYVEVNEEGTEAAAATGAAMTLSAKPVPLPPPPVFQADHPFLFLIWDDNTGSILFLGRVADPSA